MEKVKVTKEQEHDLDKLRSGGFAPPHIAFERYMDMRDGAPDDKESPLAKLSPEQVSLALCGWYEVELEFKAGDWAVWKNTNGIDVIKKIKAIDSHKIYADWLNEGNLLWAPSVEVRHATPSEIAAEKERRFFDRHGRKPWELKKWDLLRRYKYEDAYTVESVEENRVYFKEGGSRRLENIKTSFKVACFAESRLDRGEHDE